MKKKKIGSRILSLLLTLVMLCGLLPMSALAEEASTLAEKTEKAAEAPSATISDVTVTGKVGERIQAEATITLKNAEFAYIGAEKAELNSPDGVVGRVNVENDDRNVGTLKITGTPAHTKDGVIELTIGTIWDKNYKEIKIKVDHNPNAVWDIKAADPVNVTGIDVVNQEGKYTVEAGKTLQLNAIVTPSNATDQTVTWSLEPANGIASIDENGLLTAGNTPGAVTVKATANDGSGVVGTKDITVTKASNGIVINADTPASGEGWTWDNTSNALTLNGINIEMSEDSKSHGIDVQLDEPINIVIADNSKNTINTRVKPGVFKPAAIFSKNDIIMRGGGTLDINTKHIGILSASGDITIEENPTINIDGAQSEGSYGFGTSKAININAGNIKITNFKMSMFSDVGVNFNGGETIMENESADSVTVYAPAGTLKVSDSLNYWGWNEGEYVPDGLKIFSIGDLKIDTFVDIKSDTPATKVKVFSAATPIKDAKITIAGGPFAYTGEAIKPEITASVGGSTLTKDVDYTVAYTNNTDAGEATVTLTGIGKYGGNVSANFTIAKAQNLIDKVTFEGKTVPYDGAAHSLSVTEPLPAGVTVSSYENNDKTAVGTYNVIAHLNGGTNYENADKTATLAISPMMIKDENVVTTGGSVVYNGKAHQFETVTVTVDGKVLTEKTDYTLDYENNINAGTAKAVVKGSGNYGGTIAKTFEIKAIALTEDNVPQVNGNFVSNGKPIEPKLTIKVGETTLTEGKDYTLAYENNIEASLPGGLAKVMVKGMGNYAGTIERTFVIAAPVPGPTPTPAPSPTPTPKPVNNVKTGTTDTQTGAASAIIILSVMGLAALGFKRKLSK